MHDGIKGHRNLQLSLRDLLWMTWVLRVRDKQEEGEECNFYLLASFPPACGIFVLLPLSSKIISQNHRIAMIETEFLPKELVSGQACSLAIM